jgi:hypothetical protein
MVVGGTEMHVAEEGCQRIYLGQNHLKEGHKWMGLVHDEW